MAEKKEALAKIVGNNYVFENPEILEKYSKDMSFVHPITPTCVVKPNNMEEVQKIIKWANDTLTPLVPVSSSPPRFRGDTVPSIGGAVVVDLSRMKKIIKIDRHNRVVIVEAGITFSELQSELGKVGLRLNMPLLPRSSKSVVGSLLEREPVIMPKYQWDIADPLACTEVIFGTGDLFRTGSAAGPGTLEQQWESGAAQKTGAGPAQVDWYRFIQGSQGTMGIVTWASVRCELQPKVVEPFFTTFSNLNDLFEFVNWINRLRLVDECVVLNNCNLATIFSETRSSLPPWMLFFCVSGYEYLPEERVSWQIEQIMEAGKKVGAEPIRAINGISASSLLNILQRPSEEPYWKLRNKGSCYDIFFLSTHGNIQELIKVMYDVAIFYGYSIQELGIYLQPIVQGTGYHCEFNLFYNPNDAKDVGRVKQISSNVIEALMNKGAFFSRPYGNWADPAYRRDAVTTMVLKKIKGVLDPNNVMNPGKLCF